MLRSFARVLVVAAVCALPTLALGQGGVTGSVVGYVFDQGGQPLKGIKIVTTSATQIGGGKTTYTNDEGFFRFVGLLPGTFEVSASAKGLRTVLQKDIAVGVSSSAEINLVMEVESQQLEEVKVIEKAPIVSTTTSSVKEVYDEEFVDNLPVDQKTAIESFVGSGVPGAVSGNANQARIRGGNPNQTAYLVDGFYMSGQRVTMKALAAFEVQTAGYGAEGAASPGGVVSMVTKSGSNKFEFDVNAFAEDTNLRFFKVDAIDNTDHGWVYYMNPNFSGPIIKDRLWYFANIEFRSELTTREKDPSGIAATPRKNSSGNVRGSVKFTWQVSPRNKAQAIVTLNRDFAKNTVGGFGVEQEAQGKVDNADAMVGLIWESMLTDTLLFRSQFALQDFRMERAPERCRTSPEDCDHIYPITQSFPRSQTLQNFNTHDQRFRQSLELINKFEWFGSSKVFGDHNVKLQNTYYFERVTFTQATPGDQSIVLNGNVNVSRTEYFSNDPRLGDPRYGYFIAASGSAKNVAVLSDSMRLTRHFTLSPGLSLVYSRASNNFGNTLIDAQGLAPSIAAVWDATHDGRTAVRGSFSSMVDLENLGIARQVGGSRVTRKCNWDATSQTFTSDCAYSGGDSGRTIGLPCGASAQDQFGRPCRETLQIPRTWEYTAGVEREIVQGVGIGTDFVYRQFSRQYELIETNKIWNNSGTELDPDGGYKNGRAQTVLDLETPPEARRRYIGVTTTVHKREGALKLTAAYTWSQINGTVQQGFDNEYGDIPGRDVYLLDSYLGDDARHAVRTRAVYQITKWLTTGIEWRYTSGQPYSRRFWNTQTGGFADYRARPGINPGNNINDPTDDRPIRLPDQQNLNVQLRANLKPITGVNFEAYVDVLNVLSLRTVTGVETQDTPLFQQATGYLPPMRLRIGARYKF